MKDIHIKLLYLVLGIGAARVVPPLGNVNTYTYVGILILLVPILLTRYFKNQLIGKRYTAYENLFVNVNMVTICVITLLTLLTLYAVNFIALSKWFISKNVYLQEIIIALPTICGILFISYIYSKIINYLNR